jgi:hypothetical protein
MSSDDAWRLLTNNLTKERQATLQREGSPEITAILCETRAVIGAPT